ncbi:MAG: mitochondrial fission ELM1 family protein [Hyphomicrobiaceae bacterium]|nr:mitochondrial fission ELM1 family protein [Hyphomicrobiaceae bacterium]
MLPGTTSFMINSPDTTPARSGCLSGARGWIITDGKAGMVVQATGVAEALGLEFETKQVAPRGLCAIASPWGPVSPTERLGQSGSLFAPPWPDVAIATGRASIPYIRAIKRAAGSRTFTVVLQDPKTGPGTADLIWVPAHDRRRGANVLTTLTAPHSYGAARIAALRASLPEAIRALPRPLVTVVLGGKNGVYKFTDADDDRLQASLASLAGLGASFLITPSRRTHRRLVAATEMATRSAPRILWDGSGENPYPYFLAAADLLVVTADSVNMCGEACATGRPVYVFTPSGGSAKFSRFHEGLAASGATRPLPDRFDQISSWDYRPLDSAREIALEIEARFARRRQMLSGLYQRGTAD